jgi:CubicO group peptidase (beta-lactamase class C family)
MRPADQHRQAVTEEVAPLIRDGWLAGVSVALLHAGGTELYGFGKAGADGAAPTADTVFEIGSVTKVFTAVVLAEMVRRGQVRLDQPVAELLPAGTTVPTRDGKVITLEHLATHTSGLPRLPVGFAPKDAADPYVDFDEARLLASLKAATLERAPGVRYAYSNLGAGLLGWVLARRAGKPYEALVRELVTAPLGLSDTAITLGPAQQARFAQGHDPDGRSVPAWAFQALAGAGALRSTARDLARFLWANLGKLGPALHPALTDTHRQRHETPGVGRIGLGWQIGGKGARWHNGGTFGFHSFVAVHPERGVGVVVLASTATDVVDGLGSRLIQRLLGEPLRPLKIPPTVAVAPAVLDRYVGSYEVGPGAILAIRRDGDRLWARLTGQPELGLYAMAAHRFYYRSVKARVTFVLEGGDGPVNALRLYQGKEAHVAKRVAPSP